MTVSVVIPHYFVAREPNLVLIVRALQTSSRPPDEIVIWNNDAPLGVTMPSGPAVVRVLQSPWNLGCKARFLGAIAATGDTILFQDNDLCVEPRTLEGLLCASEALPGAVVALEGRVVRPDVPYRGWRRVKGGGKHGPIAGPVPIDITLGRMELMARPILMRVLLHFPFRDETVMDDLAFSTVARDQKVPCYIVPYGPGSGFMKLSTYGVGFSVTHKDAYYAERDRVCQSWRAREIGDATS